MATTRSALTEEDIRTLVKGATPDERAHAAKKLCATIETVRLSDADRELAGEILRVMAGDAAELVRRAISETLKTSPLVPRDVALRMARDVEAVCLPMLSFSPAFSDRDLAEIVRLGGPVRQLAIARRPMLSRAVTEVIAEHGSEKAVAAACANAHADFAEDSLTKVMARFETSEKVLAAIAYRSVLPLAVTEKLITLVSDQIRDHLVTRHAVSPTTALEIAVGGAERATIDLVDQAGRAADVKAFVTQLHASQRLTASLLLRALAHGHMTFFEWGLAAPVPRFPGGGRHLPLDGVRRRAEGLRTLPAEDAPPLPHPADCHGPRGRGLPAGAHGSDGRRGPGHGRARLKRLLRGRPAAKLSG